MRTCVAALLSAVVALASGHSRVFAQNRSNLVTILPIPGHPNAFVEDYFAKGWHLRVTVGKGINARTLWARPLPSRPQSLKTPGPTGVFSALVLERSSATLYAYRLSRTRVVSAVAGHPGGQVQAPEGITFMGENFVARTPDRAHAGSVRYRNVVHYAWDRTYYHVLRTTVAPDYPLNQMPIPNAVFHTHHGDTILLRLEIADTEQKRETGLMNRGSLDADSGMIFTWPQPVHESFWMQNTFVPLSIAFLGSGRVIQETQDMEPMTTTPHTPALQYSYAIEVNSGFYANHGIVVGDTATLHLQANPQLTR